MGLHLGDGSADFQEGALLIFPERELARAIGIEVLLVAAACVTFQEEVRDVLRGGGVVEVADDGQAAGVSQDSALIRLRRTHCLPGRRSLSYPHPNPLP
jgi:hypothetical protein